MHAPHPTHSTVPPLGRADRVVFIPQVLRSTLHRYVWVSGAASPFFHTIPLRGTGQPQNVPALGSDRLVHQSSGLLAESHGKWGQQAVRSKGPRPWEAWNSVFNT